MRKSDFFDSPYFTGRDLVDRQFEATIKRVEKEMVGNEGERRSKAVLYFEEDPKGLVFNSTNWDTVEAAYGLDVEAWIGKRVILYGTEVQFKNQTVPGIRIRIPKASSKAA